MGKTKGKDTTELLPGQVLLADFADLHRVSRNSAYGLWSRGMIKGTKSGQGKHVKIIIDETGKRDAYIQFQILPDFVTCDNCPHEIKEK